jgi:hypothetical protein
VIDEEIEWTDTKRIETKKVICGFEHYECRGYQLKLRSSAAETSPKQIPYKLRNDVTKLTERYTAISDKYSSSFHEPLMFTLEQAVYKKSTARKPTVKKDIVHNIDRPK